MNKVASSSNSRPFSFFHALVVAVAASGIVSLGFSAQQPAKPTQVVPTQGAVAEKGGPAVFEIDDVHSMALFRVQHLGAGRFWGLFNDVGGTVQYTPEKFLSMNITIQTGSVETHSEQLNRHLKSPDFFNAVEFPAMTFVSSGSKLLASGRFEVVGDLTIRGVTKKVTVPVECSAISKMGGATRAGFEATFELKRSDFGVSYGVEKKMIGDETRVVVSLEGIEAGSVAKP